MLHIYYIILHIYFIGIILNIYIHSLFSVTIRKDAVDLRNTRCNLNIENQFCFRKTSITGMVSDVRDNFFTTPLRCVPFPSYLRAK